MPLPIDDILPDLKRALASRDAAVLQAPPGAGKTTRVPPALLDEPWLAGQSILLLEPRRLAASNAARYMAISRGEEVGRTVGYTIRFERRTSAATRIEVVTEGILTRRLQSDPLLSGVGLVIFDEFHERHLHSDLALALCRDAQSGLREDLKLLVMSATLDAAPVARLLGDAPLLTSSGRTYPVEVRYLAMEPQGRLAETVTAAVRRALRETEGDLLVFLPGAGEIRRCLELLTREPAVGEPQLCPLYGDLPFAEQERAILPGSRRKVVLATNIAETSLTIEGITVVVDSGFERRPRFDVARGVPHLQMQRISRGSAEQRAGRAGRLGPGICYRLWTEGVQGSLLPFTPPEIRNADLASLALELARWGVDADDLQWLDPPPAGALAGARQLLVELGALDAKGRLTPMGEAMAEQPAHPRLARLLLAGRADREAPLACDLAALLGERDMLRAGQRSRQSSDSDLLDRLEALHDWRSGRLSDLVDAAACATVERTAAYYRRLFKVQGETRGVLTAERLAPLLAPAWPDRLGAERAPGTGRYLLAGGQGGRLSRYSAVRNAAYLLALDMAGGSAGEGDIRLASAVSEGQLRQLFAERVQRRRAVFWDDREERVLAREEERLGALLLTARPVTATAQETVPAVLEGVARLGLEVLNWTTEGRQWLARARFLARTFPEEGWPDLSPAALLAGAPDWLAPYLPGVRSRADLARFDPLPALQSFLDHRQRQQLAAAAPSHLLVPSGSRLLLDYQGDGAPVLAVKLQELFGLAETPRIAGGRVPVLLHLLSPARRPIQVTADLRSFWDSVYPEVKKELKGRYPKHPWPDDPWKAVPTRSIKGK
jgi:ATP-dependent helicase HrpB